MQSGRWPGPRHASDGRTVCEFHLFAGIGPTSPRLVCIGGLPGSGKTTLGLALARRLGGSYEVIDPDAVRLELLGRTEIDVVTDDDMTPTVTRAVVDLMVAKAQAKLHDGRSLIVPSAFVIEEMRQRFEALARELNATFRGVWLDVPFDVLRRRLLARDAVRASGKRDGTTLSAVSGRHVETLRVGGAVTWSRVDGARKPSVVLARVLALLHVDPAARSGPG